MNSLYEYYEKRNPTLKKLDRAREKTPFWYSTNDRVLGIRREHEGQCVCAYFNFSEKPRSVYFDAILTGKDLVTGEKIGGLTYELKPYGFLWILTD